MLSLKSESLVRYTATSRSVGKYCHLNRIANTSNETKYLRMDQETFGCLPQILLGPFLDSLPQISLSKLYLCC